MSERIPGLYTIEELETESGVSERTIRYYVAEGLLPRADKHGQYSVRHLNRLRLIQKYKAQHLRLEGIRGVALLSDEEVASLLQEETPAMLTQPLAPKTALDVTTELRARRSLPPPPAGCPPLAAPFPPPSPSALPENRGAWEHISVTSDLQILVKLPISARRREFLERVIRFARETEP